MNKKIQEKIETQIRLSFKCSEIESLAIDFTEYQARNRGHLFGELTMLHYEMFNGKDEDILSIAATIEILALATDILDDLQDQDNKDSPWQSIEQSIVLNLVTGLFLLSKKTLDGLDLTNRSLVNELYYSMIFQSMAGQHLDLKNKISDEKDYINIVIKKSSSLATLACLLGATAADANNQQRSIVKDYGEKLGLISQFKNDFNDIYTWNQKSDLQLKRKTFPILYMININELSMIKDYYLSDNSFEVIKDKKQEVIEEMERLGAIRYTKARIELDIIEALEHISQLDASDIYKTKLKNIFKGGIFHARGSTVFK